MRTIWALQLAAEVCLRLRYAHYPSCCVEASNAGAEALRRNGVAAQAIGVTAMIATADLSRAHWLGATPEEIYAFMLEHGSGPPLTFDEFKARAAMLPDSDDPIHMVIEIKSDRRLILDLTVGQAYSIDHVPPSIIVELVGDLPQSAEGDQTCVTYLPRKRALPETAVGYRNEGLTEDILAVMRVALRCKLDRREFAKAVLREFEAAPGFGGR